MSEKGFSAKVLGRLSEIGTERQESDDFRERRSKKAARQREILELLSMFLNSIVVNGSIGRLKRRLYFMLSFVVIVIVSAAAEKLTTASFFFWYILFGLLYFVVSYGRQIETTRGIKSGEDS